jgi:hypothetical protein
MLSSFENSYKKKTTKLLLENKKKPFWRKQEIKNKNKKIKQMEKWEKMIF